MFHPYSAIRGTFETDLDGARGPGNCIWSQEFYETDTSRGFVRGFTYEIARGGGPVNTAVNRMLSGKVAWGEDHHRSYRSVVNRITGMVGICEDLPEEHNTVTLDADLKDSDGIPGTQDRLHVEREQPQDAGLLRRAGNGGAGSGGGRRRGNDGANTLWGLAPDGHRAHGNGPAGVGGQRMGALATT